MTPTGLRIAVADDEPDMREFFERFLPRLGHEVTSVAEDGRQLVEQCRLNRPDLIVTDVRMPGMTGLDALEALAGDPPIPAVLVTAHADEGWVKRVTPAGVFAYLLKPVTERDLGPAIAVAWKRHEQEMALRKEADDLRRSLDERKLIERAKGAVGRRLGVNEDDSYRRLRKYASDRNIKLAEAAAQVMRAEEVFHSMDG